MLRKVRKNYKRLVAFLLSAAMIITNVGGNAGTVFAAEGQEERESAIFMVDGQEILEAIQGLKDQVAFSKEDLEEMGLDASRKGVLKKYEKLLLPEEGKVYELALNINTELALEGTALQVFYNGKTKEVIFLYMNESGQSVDCYVNIDGYETKVVTVEANDANVTAGVQETTAGEETGEEPGNGSGGSGSSGGGSGSTGGSGGSGNGGSGSGSSGASDGQSAEDGTSGEATEGSKEEASSADEGNGSEEDADKASEEETKAEAPKEESKADETGSAKEESKSEADGDGKEQPEKGTDGKDDKDEKESADSDKAENGGEEADKKETESARPEGSGQDKGTSDKDGSQKPSDADSGKDTDKAEGDAGKEDDSADKAGDQGSKDDKEDAADKGSDDAKGDSADKADGSDSKEDSADKADGSDSKEDSADKADSSDSKEDSADKADSSDSKEDSADKADDSGSKGDSADKADGGSDDASSSKDEDKSSGSGDSGSDGAGADSSNDGGSSDRHDGNRLSLSMSRHQAGIVAIQLDEIQDEGEAEDEAEEETTTVEETEEETEEETTTVKETEEETEKETKAEAVKEETEGNVAEEETTEKATEKETEAETTEKAAEKETEAETTEKADKEETAKEESKAEETEKATETAAETKETEKETVKAEESKPEEETEKETTEAEAADPKDTAADTSEDAKGTEAEAADTKESTETEAPEEGTTAPASENVTEEDASQTEGGNQGSADSAQGDSEELSDDWEIPGKLYDTVTVYETINARAYCVELKYVQKIVEATKGEEIVPQEYHIDYVVNPGDAAKVKGDELVAEGENLYFAVELEEGYEIASVYANGNVLEAVEDADSIEDEISWKGYSHVYQIEEISEDVDVEIELLELETIIPAAVYTAEMDDAIIAVDVPDGAFEEEVELKAVKIDGETELKELTDQANDTLKENQSIAALVAYDITFISLESGEEVEPLKPVAVSMSFKQAIVSGEEAEEAKGISVVHLPDSAQAETVATVENVETTEISFQADSFSKYMLALIMMDRVSVGGTNYPSIKVAANMAEDGATITLLEDITESVELIDRSFTFDLNGHTWTGKGNSTLIANISKKDVSITITGEGTIVADAGYRAVEMAKKSTAGVYGNLRMTGVILEGSGSTLTKTIAVASGTSKKSGGILAAVDTNVVAENCEFRNGIAGDKGGAVLVAPYYTGSQVEASFTGCSFHGNRASRGGAISSEVSGKHTGRAILLKVDNCTFEENTASSGGAIVLESDNTGAKASVKAEITNETQFIKNEASSYGGAIYSETRGFYEDDALTVANSYFTENTATGSGGGGAIYAKTSLNLSNVEFRENTSQSLGGAIYVNNSESTVFNATFDKAKFIGNTTTSSGGAMAISLTKAKEGTIALQNGTTFERNQSAAKSMSTDGGGAIHGDAKMGVKVSLSDVAMHDNSAKGYGGAIYADIKNLEITDTKIYNNTTEKAGGGIYLNASQKDAQAVFTRLEARRNTAQTTGGGISLSGKLETGKAIFNNCTISDNTAGTNGGGIYSQLPEITISDTVVNGNTANKSYGGGAYLSSYKGGGAYTVSGSTVFYGNKAPNDPKTAAFKISGNTPSADVFVRNSSGTSSTESEATLQGFDELLAKETAMGNITYKLAHTNPATQKYGYAKNVSSAYSVGYYSTKAVGDCVYLSPSDNGHEASGSGNVVVETTLEGAVASAKANNFNEIYVCGTVNVTKEDEEILNNSGITFKRCSECTNTVLFHIEKGEDVTFNGIKIDGDKILSTASLVSVAGTLTIDGETDIRNGNNSSSSGGGAIYVNADATLNVNGGRIEDNVAINGGAIATGIVTPVINISGGSIKGNRASKDGGAIFSNSAILHISGGTLESNIAGSNGGAICAEGIQKEFGRHSKVYVEGGTFRGNSCGGNGGGAIYVAFFSELYVGEKGGRPLFENNRTSQLGGAIALYQWASGKIYSADFIGNKTVTAISNNAGGGALYINAGCSMEMKNLYVVGNTQKNTTTGGGGLYTCSTGRTAIFKSEGAFIADNTGAGGGPADIYFWGGNGALAYVSDYVLGGADANWTRSNGSEAPELWGTSESFIIVSHVDDGGKATAEAIAREEGVVMEGNHSDSWGAAIANNGMLTIGTEELTLTVNKAWKGDETKVPDEILVYLMKKLNGGEWEKVTPGERKEDAYMILNQGNRWSYTWENLGSSKAVDWSVSEAAINGYTGTVSGPELDTKWDKVGKHYIITLTNTENPDAKTASLQVEKQLFSSEADPNAEFTFTVSLDAEGPFAYRIWESNHKTEDLKPIYDDASKIKISLKPGQIFTIEGIPVGTKYSVTEESGNYLAYIDGVLNEDAKVEGLIESADNSIVYMNIEKTQIKVTKVWDDAENQDGIRPESIQVELVKVIGEGEEKKEEPTGTILELNEGNNWTGIFKDLPKYEVDSSPVIWGIKEVNAGDGYTSVITADGQTGFVVTNTHTPETVDITGEKFWDDADNQDGKRPESITVILYANGKKVGSQTVTADAQGNWNWKFENLPKYYDHGQLISYTFEEEIKGLDEESVYKPDITDPSEDNGYAGKIVNSFAPGLVDWRVFKVWEDGDNQDGFRPESITVQLKANGLDEREPVVLNAENNWNYTWKDLDEYRQGEKIQYTVEEISQTDAYSVDITNEFSEGTRTGISTITNTHAPETTTIKAVKEWEDQNNQDGIRPEGGVSVQLMADGTAQGEPVILDGSNNWTYQWENLPVYREGKKIDYAVSEVSEINGYLPIYQYNREEGVITVTVTNVHLPEVKAVKAVKVWDDQNNQDGLRPEGVEVQLMANGVSEGNPITLNAGNNWTYEWKNLPVYQGSRQIDYTVVENTKVDQYSVSYSYDESGNALTVITITNSHKPEEPTTPTEPTTPEETTPTEPTTPAESPENPTTPSRPSGGGGGGGGRDRDRNPSLTPEPTPIPPEEVPLANIDPEDVPLAMMPSESPAEAMVIDDEGVPLFGLPRTGDRGVATGALIGMMLLSLMAACGIHVKKRKEEE